MKLKTYNHLDIHANHGNEDGYNFDLDKTCIIKSIKTIKFLEYVLIS